MFAKATPIPHVLGVRGEPDVPVHHRRWRRCVLAGDSTQLDRVHVDLNVDYTAFKSPDMRRAPNMFAGSIPDATGSLFNEMPGDHEVFGKMPGAHLMFTDEEGTAYISNLISGGILGKGFQDAQAEGEEIEEIIEVVDTDPGKTVGKRKLRVGMDGTHHFGR
jgi:hypothetical protein